MPCPLCGGTRSLAALARLDVFEAFYFNPLVAAVVIIVVVAAIRGIIGHGDWAERARFRAMIFGPRVRLFIGLGLVFANWSYLYLRVCSVDAGRHLELVMSAALYSMAP